MNTCSQHHVLHITTWTKINPTTWPHHDHNTNVKKDKEFGGGGAKKERKRDRVREQKRRKTFKICTDRNCDRKRQQSVNKTMAGESRNEEGGRKVKKRPWEEAAGLAVALRARLGTPPPSSSSSSPCKQLRAFNWFTISANDRSIQEGREEEKQWTRQNNTPHPESPHTTTPHTLKYNIPVQTLGLWFISGVLLHMSANTNRD